MCPKRAHTPGRRSSRPFHRQIAEAHCPRQPRTTPGHVQARSADTPQKHPSRTNPNPRLSGDTAKPANGNAPADPTHQPHACERRASCARPHSQGNHLQAAVVARAFTVVLQSLSSGSWSSGSRSSRPGHLVLSARHGADATTHLWEASIRLSAPTCPAQLVREARVACAALHSIPFLRPPVSSLQRRLAATVTSCQPYDAGAWHASRIVSLNATRVSAAATPRFIRPTWWHSLRLAMSVAVLALPLFAKPANLHSSPTTSPHLMSRAFRDASRNLMHARLLMAIHPVALTTHFPINDQR